MKKREANFTVLFRHWLRKYYDHINPTPIGAAFELKQTLTESIAFSSVQEHQIIALQAVQTTQGLLYKAPDDSRGIKPFDMFYLRDADAYIVIKYPTCFVLIDIDDFIVERDVISKRKSLTSARAREIATYTVDL